jgi:hypothetical protein
MVSKKTVVPQCNQGPSAPNGRTTPRPTSKEQRDTPNPPGISCCVDIGGAMRDHPGEQRSAKPRCRGSPNVPFRYSQQQRRASTSGAWPITSC